MVPKYKFRWENLPSTMLDRVAVELNLPAEDPPNGLKRRFGARPNEDFIAKAWLVMLDTWIADEAGARTKIVGQLRSRRLGKHTMPADDRTAQIEYLRTCRNSNTLRDVVLVHLLALGEQPQAAPADPAPAVAKSSPEVGRKRRSKDWPAFAKALVQSLDALGESCFLILNPKNGSGRFVQFATQVSSGIRVETASNSFLAGDAKLGTTAQNKLAKLGWSAPTGSPDESTPEHDPDGSPNYFREYEPPVRWDKLASFVVDTMVDVLGVSHPAQFAYTAFTEKGSPILLPGLGLSLEEPAPSPTPAVSSPQDLTQLVGATIAAQLGVDNVPTDDDGDFPIRVGSAMVFVRIIDKMPIVRIFSPMLLDVPGSPGLLEAVNEINQTSLFIRAAHFNGVVTISADVLGSPFVPEHFTNSLAAVGQFADEHDEALQAQLGGRTFLGEVVRPARVRSETGGYL